MLAYSKEVARQPEELERLLHRPHRLSLDTGRPIRLTGIGTSLHACRVAESWFRELTEDAVDVRAEEAHYLALHGTLRPDTQVVVVSHRGTKRFSTQVLERARAVGADTVAVTGDSEVTPSADSVLRTCSPERAGTHTVSYTSALAVLAELVVNSVGEQADEFREALARVPEEVSESLETSFPDSLLQTVAESERVLVAGFGIDAITADEAALKLKEGTYVWTESLTTELALHGPPAAYDDRLVAFLLDPNRDDGGRTETLETLLSDLGVPYTVVGTTGDVMAFTSSHDLTRPFTAIAPFQRLVEALAPVMDSNPDTIRTDVSPWDEALGKIEL